MIPFTFIAFLNYCFLAYSNAIFLLIFVSRRCNALFCFFTPVCFNFHVKKACNLLLIVVLKVCMYWIWILFLSHNAFAGCTSLQFRVKILIEHAIDLYLTLKATLSNCSKQISFLFIISLNTKEIVISGLSLWIIVSEPSAMMNFLFQPDGSAWLLGRPFIYPSLYF